jgi:hypothetical protein
VTLLSSSFLSLIFFSLSARTQPKYHVASYLAADTGKAMLRTQNWLVNLKDAFTDETKFLDLFT